TGYADFSMSKGVHLTRFTNPNTVPVPEDAVSTLDGKTAAQTCTAGGATWTAPGVCVPNSGDTVSYLNTNFGFGSFTPFPNVGTITDTVSSAKSLYRAFTIGARKRMSHRFLFDANYTYSKD